MDRARLVKSSFGLRVRRLRHEWSCAVDEWRFRHRFGSR